MTFDRELWQRARPVFDELIDLDSGARRARLTEIGNRDRQLREAVERLLGADENSESALHAYTFGAPRTVSADRANPRDPLGVTGRTVSHFRVTEYLAAGGMGAVYCAEDLQLGRTVALKFPLPHQHMDEAVKERFVNEARSAAALDHPNLCTVHEIGESEHGVFLAMPLYPGQTLRQRMAAVGALPPAEALDIVRQITTGLASAHAAGIVHRDLKPGNVMLLPDGTAKVLDFGLAKIRDISLTKSHTALGTIGYVAPEQIRNERVDARTDLWSIGVMLYEMLTGTVPFGGEHEVSVLHAILHEEPQRVSRVNSKLPPAYDRLVEALLEKDPADRYPSAQALLTDIAALERGGTVTHRARFWKRTDRRRRLRQIALPLSVVALLTLAVTGWYAYQNRTSPAATVPLPTLDREAYELYLRGRYVWNQAPRTRENLQQSLIFYRAALERDPRFALAHSGTAAAYVNMANFGYMPSHEALARAEVAADRALALDSSLADAHAARGFALAARTRFTEAESSLRRAIDLNPNSQWAHHYYAILLAMLNRLDEAKEETRRTLAIDPLSLPGNTMLGIEFAAEGNLEDARTQLRRALQLSPGFPLTLYYLGAVEASRGDYAAAREVLEQALATAPGFPGVRAALAHVYGKLGRNAESRRLITELRNAAVDDRTRLNYALALAVNGPVDSAFAMLRAARWDVPTLVELRHSPLLRTFRLDPRYPELLAGLGLEP